MIGLEGEQQNSPHYFLGKQSKWYVFFNSSVYVKVRNTPHSNHASIPTNMKSRPVLCCAVHVHLLYFLARLSTSLNFKLLFSGTEA